MSFPYAKLSDNYNAGGNVYSSPSNTKIACSELTTKKNCKSYMESGLDKRCYSNISNSDNFLLCDTDVGPEYHCTDNLENPGYNMYPCCPDNSQYLIRDSTSGELKCVSEPTPIPTPTPQYKCEFGDNGAVNIKQVAPGGTGGVPFSKAKQNCGYYCNNPYTGDIGSNIEPTKNISDFINYDALQSCAGKNIYSLRSNAERYCFPKIGGWAQSCDGHGFPVIEDSVNEGNINVSNSNCRLAYNVNDKGELPRYTFGDISDKQVAVLGPGQTCLCDDKSKCSYKKSGNAIGFFKDNDFQHGAVCNNATPTLNDHGGRRYIYCPL